MLIRLNYVTHDRHFQDLSRSFHGSSMEPLLEPLREVKNDTRPSGGRPPDRFLPRIELRKPHILDLRCPCQTSTAKSSWSVYFVYFCWNKATTIFAVMPDHFYRITGSARVAEAVAARCMSFLLEIGILYDTVCQSGNVIVIDYVYVMLDRKAHLRILIQDWDLCNMLVRVHTCYKCNIWEKNTPTWLQPSKSCLIVLFEKITLARHL